MSIVSIVSKVSVVSSVSIALAEGCTSVPSLHPVDMLLYNCPHIHHHFIIIIIIIIIIRPGPGLCTVLAHLSGEGGWRFYFYHHLPRISRDSVTKVQPRSCLVSSRRVAKPWHLTWGCGLGIKLKDKVLINNTLGTKILVRPSLFRVPSSRDTRSSRLVGHGRGNQHYEQSSDWLPRIVCRHGSYRQQATGARKSNKMKRSRHAGDVLQCCRKCTIVVLVLLFVTLDEMDIETKVSLWIGIPSVELLVGTFPNIM